MLRYAPELHTTLYIAEKTLLFFKIQYGFKKYIYRDISYQMIYEKCVLDSG